MTAILCCAPPEQSGSLGVFIQVGSALGAIVVFAYGVWKYDKGLQWKRAEFVAKEIQDFNRDSSTRMVKLLLDWTWNNDKLALSPELPDDQTVISDAAIERALRIPRSNTESFSDSEFELRYIFDRFFDDLERFGNFMRAELIMPGDVSPYLEYWMKIITGQRGAPGTSGKSETYRDAIHKYIDFYGWTGVKLLFERCGHPLKVFPPEAYNPERIRPEIPSPALQAKFRGESTDLKS